MLAEEHHVTADSGPNGLLPRLDQSERLLREYNRATYAVNQARRITPASEWILDNFYLVLLIGEVGRKSDIVRKTQYLPVALG